MQRGSQMRLEQRFELKGTPTDLWPYFKNLELLVSCLPGASSHGEIDFDDGIATIPLRFEVRLGPIAAAFIGKGTLTPNDADFTGAFEGSAVDRKTNSRVSGLAKFSLQAAAPPSEHTTVIVDVDYSLAGSLAQFNRAGIVRQLADTLTGEFAARLQQEVNAAQNLEAEPTDEADATDKSATRSSVTRANPDIPEKDTALNPIALIWAVIRRQFTRLINKSPNP